MQCETQQFITNCTYIYVYVYICPVSLGLSESTLDERYLLLISNDISMRQAPQMLS
jgi:hypothetical protein